MTPSSTVRRSQPSPAPGGIEDTHLAGLAGVRSDAISAAPVVAPECLCDGCRECGVEVAPKGHMEFPGSQMTDHYGGPVVCGDGGGGETMTDRHDAEPDAGRLHRRRFLGTAGIVAGTAWVAPTVISATPAAAGVPSPDPCAPTIISNSYDCAAGGFFTVAVPQGCPDVSMLRESSINGNAFVVLNCEFQDTFGSFVGIGETDTFVLRYSWVTDCTTRTVIQTFMSIPMGGPCC